MISFRQLATENDGFKFKQFHNELFPNTNASLEWFRWYFDQIGNSETRVYAAFNKSNMVGCWCVEPKKFQLNKRIIDVGRCFAVGIHPDYRRQGLFVDLSKFAIDEEKKHRDYEYVLGFPQLGKPVVAGHLKAGWEVVQHITMRSWQTTSKIDPHVSLSNINRVKSFKQVPTPELFADGFIEDATYRDLRWLKHPDNHYICLSEKGSYVVMKPYGQACHILDIRGNDESLIKVIHAAQTLAYRHRWQELTTWCADNEQHCYALTQAGFQPNSQFGLSVELLAVRINATLPLQINGAAHFAMGNEEGY